MRVAPVVRPSDFFTDSQILANVLIAEHQHAGWDAVRQSSVPVKFDRTPGIAQRAAPLFGHHSREVLREASYDNRRIDALVAAGIIVEASG